MFSFTYFSVIYVYIKDAAGMYQECRIICCSKSDVNVMPSFICKSVITWVIVNILYTWGLMCCGVYESLAKYQPYDVDIILIGDRLSCNPFCWLIDLPFSVCIAQQVTVHEFS